MAMIWDSPLTAGLARELDGLLEGERLRAHRFDWDRRELTLFFRAFTLRWCLHPERGWPTRLPAEEPPPDSRSLSAQVVGVDSPPDERLLRIRLQRVRGRIRRIGITVELMTGQWNALLLEGEEETIRHLLWTRRTEARILSVGHRYRPPEPSKRAGAGEPMAEEEWMKLVDRLEAEGGEKAVLGHLAFSSPINVEALLYRGPGSGSDVDTPDAERPPEGGSRIPASATGFRLWGNLRTLEHTRPCLLETTRGKQPYPIVIKCFSFVEFPNILAAMEALNEEEGKPGSATHQVLGRLKRALHQARGRARGLRRELDQAGDPDTLRNRANLLLARLGEVPRGASEVRLSGFQGETVVIETDPAKTPQENADQLYKEAARLERVLARLPRLLEEATAEVVRLERLREGIEKGEIPPQEATDLLPGADAPVSVPGRPERSRLPYLRFLSSGGLEIRVGRGPADNDALTFKHSRPEDIWLHARDVSGAHVVLRWSRPGAPPTRDLNEAAVLAALNSQARTAGVVPVDWTRRKHVRKPRKAGPGTVVPRETRTLFVEPDPDLPRRLRVED